MTLERVILAICAIVFIPMLFNGDGDKRTAAIILDNNMAEYEHKSTDSLEKIFYLRKSDLEENLNKLK